MNSTTSFDEALDQLEIRRRVLHKRSPKRRVKRSQNLKATPAAATEQLPTIGTMARTKRLIEAAVRVWELKRGIRE
jgi:L-fucose isomerase-like protein